MTDNKELFIQWKKETHTLIGRGEWILKHYKEIKTLLDSLKIFQENAVSIDGHAISKMDSAGALLLCSFVEKAEKKGIKVELKNFSEQLTKLLSIVKKDTASMKKINEPAEESFLYNVGKNTYFQLSETRRYIDFIGQLTMESFRILKKKTSFRLSEVADVITSTGVTALPIIALLSFMIGIVISYQMGNQLLKYGANVFIVDLLGLSVLREFGPLLSSIMVAGRSGSAFTAELGIMKINQEIDAINTLGVTPGELLLLPKILGLLIAMPLLTMWADMFGIFGGMVMANSMLGVNWYDFLSRFQHAIPYRALLIGLGKAPVFALIIASVGCFQGMQVSGSAESVGKRTTKSVVIAIFLIMVSDAIFSVLFSKFKL